MIRSIALLPCLVASAVRAQPVVIPVASDYMSSGFFQSDYFRGEEAASVRDVNRSGSVSLFGVEGENTYFGFDFDPSVFSGPVSNAVFMVEIVDNTFFGNPDPINPAEISIHSLSSDPLAVVDQNAASGPGSWIDFRDTEITASSVVSTTSVDGIGVFEWDVTALVNEWIANGDTNVAYTIGTGALLDPEGEASVAFINSSWSGLSDEVTGRIVIVPSAPTAVVLGLAGVMARRRRG